MSDLSAEGLFKRFDPFCRLWSELTDETRDWWIAQANDLAAPGPQFAAVAKPGDTVLIGFDRLMTDEEFNAMRDRLRPLKDQLGIQIGLIEGASSMVVVRPELDVNGAPLKQPESCPYTQSHTREFCGNPGCRES